MTGTLDARIAALAEAADLAAGRLDQDVVAAARVVVGKAGARLGLGLENTVVALAGTGATVGTSVQGLTQRIAATIVPLGVAALAVRVLPHASYEPGS